MSLILAPAASASSSFALQISHVVVVVTITFCFAQTNTVDDAGMVQLVTDAPHPLQ